MPSCYSQKKGVGCASVNIAFWLHRARAVNCGFVDQMAVLRAALQWPLNYRLLHKGGVEENEDPVPHDSHTYTHRQSHKHKPLANLIISQPIPIPRAPVWSQPPLYSPLLPVSVLDKSEQLGSQCDADFHAKSQERRE